MSFFDSFPILSQLKSLVQVIAGDEEGAKKTQENFAYENTFPVLSQLVSAAYAINGELDKAKALQEKFAAEVGSLTDSIPVAGHIKGVVHYGMGDNDKGDLSMKKASRSVLVGAGGVVGMVTCGPACAAAGGIAGGVAADSIITIGDGLVKGGEGEAFGNIASVMAIGDHVRGKDFIDTNEAINMIATPVLDGVSGIVSSSSGIGGNVATNIQRATRPPVDISYPFNMVRLADINNN
jgi:hypothetical protein